MDGLASVGSVGGVARQAAIPPRPKYRESVAEDVGLAALKLIRASIVVSPSLGHDLDVRA